MEYYSAIITNETLLIDTTIWINFRNIVLNKQKDLCHKKNIQYITPFH